MLPGIDLLGLASENWDLKSSVKGFPKDFALGLFADETFGPNALEHATKILSTGKVKAVRAHLNWENPNPKHTLPPLSKIKRLAPKWESLAKKFPEVQFLLSPSCEIDSGDKVGIITLLTAIQDLAPSCIPVYCPMKMPVVTGYMVEKHGKVSMGLGQIASFDGGPQGSTEEIGLVDIDSQEWVEKNSKALIAFAWTPLCNMKEAHNTLPPDKRTVSPSASYLTSLARLFDKPDPCPEPNFPYKKLKAPLLWKSHAEDSPGADPRNNRPLVLLNKKAPDITLVTHTGEPLGKMNYYGTFPGGLYRYYSGTAMNLYGWEIADRAVAESGSPYVWIKCKAKFYGPVHPVFRSPYYQG